MSQVLERRTDIDKICHTWITYTRVFHIYYIQRHYLAILTFYILLNELFSHILQGLLFVLCNKTCTVIKLHGRKQFDNLLRIFVFMLPACSCCKNNVNIAVDIRGSFPFRTNLIKFEKFKLYCKMFKTLSIPYIGRGLLPVVYYCSLMRRKNMNQIGVKPIRESIVLSIGKFDTIMLT